MNYVNIKLLILLQLLCQGKGICTEGSFMLRCLILQLWKVSHCWSALAVQKLSVITWTWGRKTILWMNSSAAEKLCGFSGILWHPVDMWSILSLLQHLSKGSIFLALFPTNPSPACPFLTCWLQLALYLRCRDTARNKEAISAQGLPITALLLHPWLCWGGLHGGGYGNLGNLTVVFLLAV